LQTPGPGRRQNTRGASTGCWRIDQHLDQAIRLDELARVSHFSAYHFHRIFHAMVGETVNDYVTCKRMEQALHRLVGQPTRSIADLNVWWYAWSLHIWHIWGQRTIFSNIREYCSLTRFLYHHSMVLQAVSAVTGSWVFGQPLLSHHQRDLDRQSM
jgi:hypothetical protein